MKKTGIVVSLLICFLLMFNVTTASAAQEAPVSGTMSMQEDSIIMELLITEDSLATNGEIQVTYDNSVMELVIAEGSDFWMIENINTEYEVLDSQTTVSLMFVDVEPLQEGGTILELVFDAKQDVWQYEASVNVTLHSDLETIQEEAFTVSMEPECPAEDYVDLDLSDASWYHEAVDYVIGNGIMIGTGEKVFAPQGITTRAEAVAVLYRLTGVLEGSLPEISETEWKDAEFKDIADDAWYDYSARWAYSKGVIAGISDTELVFSNTNVTREQFVAMLYRYAAKCAGMDVSTSADLSQFGDADQVSSWAQDAMEWAYGTGLLKGKVTDGVSVMDPQGPTTRAEAAAMIQRFAQWVD